MTVEPGTGVEPRDEAAVAVDETGQPVRAADQTLSGYARRWWQKVRSGDLGSLPILVGLVVIVIVFGSLDDVFLTERNFTNLLLQMAPVATIAIGIVFVLLIGEIDLSVAFVSAVGGVVMTLLIRPDDPGFPWWTAIAVALATTTAIGFVHALIITKAGVPSFVVTLAGLLIWSGVVLYLMTEATTTGTIRISDDAIVALANEFLPPAWGYVIGVLMVAGYALSQLQTARSRRAGGLDTKPLPILALQIAGLAVVTFGAIA